jgi:WD40 repeat protein/mono/diheme cytochrome c family protein
MTPARPLVLAGALLLLPGLSRLAAQLPGDKNKEKEVPTEVSYYRDVRPILQQHCQGCHQPAKPQGGYVMTGHADLFKKGDKDKANVVAGKPNESGLVEQIVAKPGKKPAMPKNKDPLSARDVEVIEKWIAQGAKDDTPTNAREVVDADHPPIYVQPPVITAVAYSPDGQWLAVSGHHEILLHKADGGGLAARLVGLSERVQSLAFSPDGKSLAMAGGSPGRFGEVQVWDVDRKKLRLSVPVTFDTLYGVSWSYNGSKIAFGCADNTLWAIDAKTGQQILFQGAHNDWVLGTVFALPRPAGAELAALGVGSEMALLQVLERDSRYLVSISRDMSVKLTEVRTQRFIDNVTSITPGALKGGLMALARRPQPVLKHFRSTAAGTDQSEKFYDEILVAGSDGTPRLYQMHRTKKRVIGDDFNKLREFEPMLGRTHSLAFNADGTLFAAGSSLDGRGEVRVYQTDTGKLVSKLETGPVFTVAFDPKGKTVASAGFDGMVRLSDPQTGKVVKEFTPVPLNAAAKAR